jgi:predicted RNase H-like nuclease
MPASTALRCFGLDLAWSDHRPSGLCALDSTGAVLDETALVDDDAVVDWLARHLQGPAVVAADIPLWVPNETGMRPCDRAVASAYGARGAGPHPANRSLFVRRFGRVRGEDLATRLARFGFNGPWSPGDRVLMEVYPHPGLVETFRLAYRLPYKKGPLERRRGELRRLRDRLHRLRTSDPPLTGPPVAISDDARGTELKAIEDRLDARFCAWSALVWAHLGPGAFRLFGDAATGHIAVPVRPLGVSAASS